MNSARRRPNDDGDHLKFTSLAASTRRFILVDLSAVEFISSLGLGTLVRSAAAQTLRKGKLVVLGPRPNVERVFETTRVNEVIPVFHDPDAAHEAVREAAATADA